MVHKLALNPYYNLYSINDQPIVSQNERLLVPLQVGANLPVLNGMESWESMEGIYGAEELIDLLPFGEPEGDSDFVVCNLYSMTDDSYKQIRFPITLTNNLQVIMGPNFTTSSLKDEQFLVIRMSVYEVEQLPHALGYNALLVPEGYSDTRPTIVSCASMTTIVKRYQTYCTKNKRAFF